MLNNNISRVIRWYKGICTFNMRKIHADFQWQSRFHDHHIIRNDDEYQRIADYINTNPQNWERGISLGKTTKPGLFPLSGGSFWILFPAGWKKDQPVRLEDSKKEKCDEA